MKWNGFCLCCNAGAGSVGVLGSLVRGFFVWGGCFWVWGFFSNFSNPTLI